jgi:hypothetical protein
MSDDDDTTRDEPEQPPASGSSLGWRIAAGVAVTAALVAIGVLGYLLFAGGSTDPDEDVRACIIDPASRDFTKEGKESGHSKPANCPPKGSKQQDGLVEKTTEGGFTMREIVDGRLEDTITLHVREPDRKYIDLAHAQTHAALGQPIRVYTLEVDGQEAVVYMEDAPLLG